MKELQVGYDYLYFQQEQTISWGENQLKSSFIRTQIRKNMKNSQKLGEIKNLSQNCNHETQSYKSISKELNDEIIQILRMTEENISVNEAIIALKSENCIESQNQQQNQEGLYLQKCFNDQNNFEQAEQIAQENELIPLLFHVIEYGSINLIKIEAAQIISILAGGRSGITRIIMGNGILQLSLSALDSNQSELIMLIITILGKLAGEPVKYRDSLLYVYMNILIFINLQ